MSIQISPNDNVVNSINKFDKLDCETFMVSGVFTYFERNNLKKSIEDNGAKWQVQFLKKNK